MIAHDTDTLLPIADKNKKISQSDHQKNNIANNYFYQYMKKDHKKNFENNSNSAQMLPKTYRTDAPYNK